MVFERIARLLRTGVIGFLLLAGTGLIGEILLHPSTTVASLLASNPKSTYGSWTVFWGQLIAGAPSALVLLGIYVMIAVTVGRVALAAVAFYRGRERALGTLSLAVIGLLLVALFLVAPYVQ